jgi:hypothetical protein
MADEQPQFCRQCGNSLAPDAKFCSDCGTATSTLADSIALSIAPADSTAPGTSSVLPSPGKDSQDDNWRLAIAITTIAGIVLAPVMFWGIAQGGNSAEERERGRVESLDTANERVVGGVATASSASTEQEGVLVDVTTCGVIETSGSLKQYGAKGFVTNKGTASVIVSIEIDFEDNKGTIVRQGYGNVSSLSPGRTAQWDAWAGVDKPWSKCGKPRLTLYRPRAS